MSYVLLRNICIYVSTALIVSSCFLFGRPNLNISQRFSPHYFCIDFLCLFLAALSIHHTCHSVATLTVKCAKCCTDFNHTCEKLIIVHYDKKWCCYVTLLTRAHTRARARVCVCVCVYSGPSKVEHNPFQEAVRLSILFEFRVEFPHKK
jgi:hypothetical protein